MPAAPEAYRRLLETHGFELLKHVVNDPRCGGRTVWLAVKTPESVPCNDRLSARATEGSAENASIRALARRGGMQNYRYTELSYRSAVFRQVSISLSAQAFG